MLCQLAVMNVRNSKYRSKTMSEVAATDMHEKRTGRGGLQELSIAEVLRIQIS